MLLLRRAALACTLGFCLYRSATAGELSTKPIRITQGGTAEKPALFDGNGMVIDLGIDVTNHSWRKEGDIWTSTTAIAGPKPIQPGMHTALFLDEVPITLAKKLPPGKMLHDHLRPGQCTADDAGLISFRWPKDKMPDAARIIIPPKGNVSCVTIACSHVVVKNITATHAANDGFNIHGGFVGIRLENIRALSNCDEGISAHDDVQMDVDGAEIAWNGSSVGGVADVDRSITTYKNCQVHDNVGAAFKFFGKSHSVSDTVIYNQAVDFTLGKETKFRQERIERRK